MLRRSLGQLRLRWCGRLSGSEREDRLDIKGLEWSKVFFEILYNSGRLVSEC